MLNANAVKEDLLEFFFVFSRFEFALKESSYLASGASAQATPDWDKFVKKYKLSYKPTEKTEEAVKYLLSHPPKRHKVSNDVDGKLKAHWETFQIDSNAPTLKTLVDIIKNVRNNLFHGGKYGEKGWDDEARVSLLLKHSSLIMKDWIKLEEDIEIYFLDWA